MKNNIINFPVSETVERTDLMKRALRLHNNLLDSLIMQGLSTGETLDYMLDLYEATNELLIFVEGK